MRSPVTVTIFLAAVCLAGSSAAQNQEPGGGEAPAATKTPRASDASPQPEQSGARPPPAGDTAQGTEQPGQQAPAGGNGSQKSDQSNQAAPAGGAGTSATPASPGSGSKKPLDVKNTFRNICGFCHEDYGRHAGKGPQLMNTERSDAFIVNRIKNGFPGRMPAFGSVFTDDQIHQILKFIRSLKPDEEPKNPT